MTHRKRRVTLPHVPQRFRPEERRFFQSIKEALEVSFGDRGNRLDANPTWRDLVDGGFAAPSSVKGTPPGAGGFGPVLPSATGVLGLPDYANSSIPPIPINVAVSTAVTNVYITFTDPALPWLEYAEIYHAAVGKGAPAPAVSAAVFLGRAPMLGVFQQSVEPDTRHFYWLRFVSYAGNRGPWHSAAGSEITSGVVPQTVLDTLSAQINDGTLSSVLTSGIAGVTNEVLAARGGALDLATHVTTIKTTADAAAQDATATKTEVLAARGGALDLATHVTTIKTTADAAAQDATATKTEVLAARNGESDLAARIVSVEVKAGNDLSVVSSDVLTLKNGTNVNLVGMAGWGGAIPPVGWQALGGLTENVFSTKPDPFNTTDIVWEAVSVTATDDDGGFQTANVNIDDTKPYRFTAFVYREDSFDGVTEIAPVIPVGTLLDSALAPVGAPSFFSGSPLAIKKWYLFVGHIYPSTDVKTRVVGGVYEVNSGLKVANTSYFYWGTGVTQVALSAAYRLTTANGLRQYFYGPRIDPSDDVHLPSVDDLLSGFIDPVLGAIALESRINTLGAMYTARFDVNGYVAGFGVSNDGAMAQAIFSVDQFAIGAPGNSTFAFIVDAANNRVAMDGASIVDATITDAHITTLTATKITSGTIKATESISVSGTISSTSGPYSLVLGPKTVSGKNALFSFMNGPTPMVAFYDDGTSIFTGQIVITAGSSGYTGLTDKPVNLGQINTAEGTKLIGVADNATADDPAQAALNSGSLSFNPNMTIVAADGRPAGVKSVYGGNYPTSISYQDTAKTILKVYASNDPNLGVGFPAFRVNPGTKYTLFVRAKASVASSSGFFIRIYERDTELPVGTTHVSYVPAQSEPGVADATRQLTYEANGALPATWAEYSFTYTASNSARYASVVVLNWSGITGELHIDSVYVASQATAGATWGTDVANTPANLAGLLGTEQINNTQVISVLQGQGASLIPDYAVSDASFWDSYYSLDITSGFTTVTDGKVAATAYRHTLGLDWNYATQPVALLPGKTLIHSAWMRRSADSLGPFFLPFDKLDSAMVSVGYGYRGMTLSEVTTSWGLVTNSIDCDGLIAQGIAFVRPGWAINHSPSATGWGEVQGVRIVEQIETSDVAANLDNANVQNYVDANFTNTVALDSQLALIQSQVDGNITSWFYSGVPTLANAPASAWLTTTDKDTHLGDLYYDDTTQYAYRFKKLASVYSWTRITDTDITTALGNAQLAQDTADSKRRVFVVTPVVPYDVGDLYDDGTQILRAAVAKTSLQTYSAADWTVIADVTINNKAAGLFVEGGVRYNDELPSFYRAKGKGVYSEFKDLVTLGTGTGTGTGAYGVLTTRVKWSDTSGGRIHQEVIDDSNTLFMRTGAVDDLSWGAWAKSFTQGAKPDWGVDINGQPTDAQLLNNTVTNGVMSIVRPGGGTYNGSGNIVGMIVITLPQSWRNTMLRFWVDVYNYLANTSFSLAVGGYGYSPDSHWYNSFAQIAGGLSADNRVRFAYDTVKAKMVVVIGDVTSAWAYPKITVRDFQAGAGDLTLWELGWQVSIETSEANYDFTTGADYANALLDAKSIVGQGALATASTADWATQINGAGKPTDNADVTGANTALDTLNVGGKPVGTLLSELATAQDTADGKVVTYFQSVQPTGQTAKDIGDLWIDTGNSNTLYRYDGTAWVAADDARIAQVIGSAQSARSIADSKALTFFSATAPTGMTADNIGDLWYNTATKEVTRYNGTIWEPIATWGASWGMNLIGQPAPSQLLNNLIDNTVVAAGQTGNVGRFQVLDPGGDVARISAPGPYGADDVMWELRTNGIAGGSAGFSVDLNDIDISKTYRYSVWMKSNNQSSSTYATVKAFNDPGNRVVGLTGIGFPQGPIFVTFLPAPDKWFLVVGMVFPDTTTRVTQSGLSGLYDPATGQVVAAGADVKFALAGPPSLGITAIIYPNGDPLHRVYYTRPRIDLLDGTEPSITELLLGGDPAKLHNGNQEWVEVNNKPPDSDLLNANTTPTDIGFTGDLNATYGADWLTGLVFNIPKELTPTPTLGLNLTPSYLGHYNGTSWETYIDSSGNFSFGKPGARMTFDGNALVVDALAAVDTLAIAGNAVTVTQVIHPVDGTLPYSSLAWTTSNTYVALPGSTISFNHGHTVPVSTQLTTTGVFSTGSAPAGGAYLRLGFIVDGAFYTLPADSTYVSIGKTATTFVMASMLMELPSGAHSVAVGVAVYNSGGSAMDLHWGSAFLSARAIKR